LRFFFSFFSHFVFVNSDRHPEEDCDWLDRLRATTTRAVISRAIATRELRNFPQHPPFPHKNMDDDEELANSQAAAPSAFAASGVSPTAQDTPTSVPPPVPTTATDSLMNTPVNIVTRHYQANPLACLARHLFSACSSTSERDEFELEFEDDDNDNNNNCTCCSSLWWCFFTRADQHPTGTEPFHIPLLPSSSQNPFHPNRPCTSPFAVSPIINLDGNNSDTNMLGAQQQGGPGRKQSSASLGASSLPRLGLHPAGAVVRKIVLLGARDSGKSSVALRFAENRFGLVYDPTIENSLRAQISFSGVTFVCDLLDTAGQDEYSTFSGQSLLRSHGFCLVFSITSIQTFIAVQKIHERVTDNTGLFSMPMVLVGAKCDDETRRQVSKAQAETLAASWNCSYVECSAKSNYGIDEIFVTLLVEMEKGPGLLDMRSEPNVVNKARGCVVQ
jgi:Ras family protein